VKNNQKLIRIIILNVIVMILGIFVILSIGQDDECTLPGGHLDSDCDGLSNAFEAGIFGIGTDPYNADTDGDGIDDGEEFDYWGGFSGDVFADFDGDGIKNILDWDSDGDGISDGDELKIGTDPGNEDTDGDGQTDRNEDADGDGINNRNELYIYGTDPLSSDSDGDGLDDSEEIFVYETDPNDSDSDNDGLKDGEEVITYLTDPNLKDTDGDGLDDKDEMLYWYYRGINPFGDLDGDGIPNVLDPDSDGDGWSDGYEIVNGTDPAHNDNEPYSTQVAWVSFKEEVLGSQSIIKVRINVADPFGGLTPTVSSASFSSFSSDVSITSILTTDQINNEVTNSSYCPVIGGESLYQSFISTNSSLDAVDLRFEIGGSFPAGGYTTEIKIRADNTTGTVIGNGTAFIPGPLSPGGQVDVRIEFPNPISVIAGNTFFIEWISPIQGNSYLSWMGTGNNEYTNGIAYDSSGSPVVNRDYIFITYTSAFPVVIPAFGVMEVELTYTSTTLDYSFGLLQINNSYPGFLNFTMSGSGLALDDDNDGYTNPQELLMGTDPGNPDTDGDGVLDGDEFSIFMLNPKLDLDDDGVENEDEFSVYGTDPFNPDSDFDGIKDGYEIFTFLTDPLEPDSDGDGVTDGNEVYVYETDPLDLDTDGDGFSDGEELYVYNTDPTDPSDYPTETFPTGLPTETSGFNSGLIFGFSIMTLVAIVVIISDRRRIRYTD